MSVSGRSRGLQPLEARRKAVLAPIIVAVIVTLSAGLVAWLIVEEATKEEHLCEYTVVVSPAVEGTYTVWVPMPCTYLDEAPADAFAEQAQVEGDADIELVNTSYGHALRISGSGRTEVNWLSSSYDHATGTGYYPNITMMKRADDGSLYDWEAWMSSDRDDIAVHLNYSATHRWYPKPWYVSGSDRAYELAMVPGEAGWRLVECDFELTVIN